MAADFLHNNSEFLDLLRIMEGETGILPGLIEKDYWIMHVLYGLKKQDFKFELKGGTSLSKGYEIIDRFSEDIDIHIVPPKDFGINENPRNNSPRNIDARRKFYDWLAATIKIDGVISVDRDHAFDDEKYFRSGGVRLYYETKADTIAGVKEGILLEAGFDTVTPNTCLNIRSWAYDRATKAPFMEIIDNRAVDIACYHPGYTLVEKLQTIATKFRQEQSDGKEYSNYMRQYYDVSCLLGNVAVQKFIGSIEYEAHKKARFPKIDLEIPIAQNEAFLVSAPSLRETFRRRYEKASKLYYKGQPDFDELLNTIKANIDRL
jgi:hypothetical protein